MSHSTLNTERRTLQALLENLGAAGFKPAAVWTGEEYVMAGERAGDDPLLTVFSQERAPDVLSRPMSRAEVAKVFEDYDLYAPTVHFTHKDRLTWGDRGVMVVPGNGADFISDWHCGDAAFNAIVDSLAGAACEGAFT